MGNDDDNFCVFEIKCLSKEHKKQDFKDDVFLTIINLDLSYKYGHVTLMF